MQITHMRVIAIGALRRFLEQASDAGNAAARVVPEASRATGGRRTKIKQTKTAMQVFCRTIESYSTSKVTTTDSSRGLHYNRGIMSCASLDARTV